jgi:hypothetical protein
VESQAKRKMEVKRCLFLSQPLMRTFALSLSFASAMSEACVVRSVASIWDEKREGDALFAIQVRWPELRATGSGQG